MVFRLDAYKIYLPRCPALAQLEPITEPRFQFTKSSHFTVLGTLAPHIKCK